MCYKSGKQSGICDHSNIWCDRYTNDYFSYGKLGEYYRLHTPPDISSLKSTSSIAEKELEKPLENGSELQEGKELNGDALKIVGVIGSGMLELNDK